MNKETILSQLIRYIDVSLPAEEVKAMHHFIDNHEIVGDVLGGCFIISDLCVALMDDISAENAKKQNRQQLHSAAKSIIKNIEGRRPSLAGVYEVNGRHYVCDGFALLSLPSPLGLPQAQDKIEGTPELLNRASLNSTPLTLPTAAEVKTHISIERASHGRRHTPTWDFGDDLPLVNAEYLYNLLRGMKNPRAKIGDSVNDPLYFTDDSDVTAMLLPINRKAMRRSA